MDLPRGSQMRVVARWIIGFLALMLVTTCLWPGLPMALLLGASLGWISFLGRVLPQVQPDGASVGLGVLSFLLFAVGLHWFLSWFYAATFSCRNPSAPGENSTDAIHPPRWFARWTLCIVAIVVMMFVAGISLVGITHQVAWLATAKEPLVRNSFAESLKRMKEIHSREGQPNEGQSSPFVPQ